MTTQSNAGAAGENEIVPLAQAIGRAAGVAAVEELYERLRKQMVPKEWFSQQEAAKYTGFTPQTLSRLKRAGKGPDCSTIGGKVRYKREWLDAWMLAGRDARSPS
jgi:excisionase family DNA binding protein